MKPKSIYLSARRLLQRTIFESSWMKTISPGFATPVILMRPLSMPSSKVILDKRASMLDWRSTNGRQRKLVRRRKMPSAKDKKLPTKSEFESSDKKTMLRGSVLDKKKRRQELFKKPANKQRQKKEKLVKKRESYKSSKNGSKMKRQKIWLNNN